MASSQTTGAIGGAAQGAVAGAKFGPWGAVIGGAIGGIGGFLSGGGEEEAMKLAEEQAKMIKLTSKENVRSMSKTRDQEVGFARAATSASNLQNTGSSKRFSTALESEWRRNISWEKNKALIDARTVMNGGQVAASKIESAGISNMMGGVGSFVSSGLAGSFSKSSGYSYDPWGS